MNLWRAPTENDGLKRFLDLEGMPGTEFYFRDKAMTAWLALGLDRLTFRLDLLRGERLGPGGGTITARHEVFTASGARAGWFSQDWRATAAGPAARFGFELDEGLPELPRVGLATALVPGFETAAWYGPGPLECYSDRRAAARYGTWRSTVDALSTRYILPQENGNRTGVRALALERADGSVFRVAGHGSANGGFDFTASHASADRLWEAAHWHEVERKPETFLYLDVAQRGLGTASCGPDTDERWRLRPGSYRLDLAFGF